MLEVKRERLIKGYQNQGLTQRQINNRLKKEEAKEEAEKNQKPIKEMNVSIEWKKSATWGMCPSASARIEYIDRTFKHIDGFKASGCGYDKESTVFASICNDVLAYALWNVKEEDRQKAPYGVRFNDEYNHYFEGGVGMTCYYNIMNFLGGELKHISSGKTYDCYNVKF